MKIREILKDLSEEIITNKDFFEMFFEGYLEEGCGKIDLLIFINFDR